MKLFLIRKLTIEISEEKIINLDILDKLEEKQEGVAHKPANYYQFNVEKYESHIEKGFFKFEF